MVTAVDWLLVPDATRHPVAPADPPPDRVDGFRFARTVDGTNDDGSPRISPERGYVTDPAERERLLAYLTAGTTVVETLARGPDMIDPTRQLAVPATVRTDGTWVWAGSAEYYLRWHGVAPEPELRQRIEEHGYRCPPVEPETVARAVAATGRRAAHVEQRGAPDRFPPDVNGMLLTLGWHRGRDLGRLVDDWLAARVTERPFPAALAVMREFGGLTSLENGPGRTATQLPFTIYPAPSGDLTGFAPDVQALGRYLGLRTFQVGEADQGLAAIVVDEAGRVFLAGPVELFAGGTVDEALVRMLQGIRCDELP